MKKNALLTCCIFIAALLIVTIGFNFGINIYDEANGVFGAQRVLNGDVPYRDFWTMYAPGWYYLLGGIFALTGPSLLVSRMVNLLFLFGILAVARLISKKESSLNSLVIMLVMAVWMGANRFDGRALMPAVFFALISLLLVSISSSNKKTTLMFFSGISAGAATLLRHDLGGYIMISIVLSILYKSYVLKTDKNANLVSMMSLIVGYVIVFLPFAAWMINAAGWSNVYGQIIKIPAEVFPRTRAISYPVIWDMLSPHSLSEKYAIFWTSLLYIVPPVIYLFSIQRLIFNKNAENKSVIFNITVAGILFYCQTFVRSDFEHLFPSFFISMILLPFLIPSEMQPKGKSLFLAFCALLCVYPLSLKAKTMMPCLKGGTIGIDSPKGKGILVEKNYGIELNSVLQCLKASRDETFIFSASSDNSAPMINDIMLYFLADRKCPNAFHELHPGVADRADNQQAIAGSLRNVNHIARLNLKLSETAYNPSHRDSLLEKYITNNYSPVLVTKNYEILKKNGGF